MIFVLHALADHESSRKVTISTQLNFSSELASISSSSVTELQLQKKAKVIMNN